MVLTVATSCSQPSSSDSGSEGFEKWMKLPTNIYLALCVWVIRATNARFVIAAESMAYRWATTHGSSQWIPA